MIYKNRMLGSTAKHISDLQQDINKQGIQQILAQKGLIVGNGYKEFKNKHVRIANFPSHSLEQCNKLIKEIENIIDTIEKELPPIKSFFISGGTELASLFDIARTISRRAERRVIAVADEGKVEIKASTKSYLNRLSSILYALARFSNFRAGITEESPDYK